MLDDPFAQEDEADEESPAGLADLVDAQRSLLISVATGGPGINSVDHEYKKRHRQLGVGLKRLGLDPPFKWKSLWDWYGYYSGKLGSYQSRRVYINDLTDPVLEDLERFQTRGRVSDLGEVADTWPTLNGRLEELKERVTRAATPDDLQDVGRRAREIIIAAVNVVFDPSMVPDGEQVPKGADAKKRLEYLMDDLVPGGVHVELRKLMRSALELAQKVTHSEGMTRVDAFAAAQATVLVVRTIQEMHEEAES